MSDYDDLRSETMIVRKLFSSSSSSSSSAAVVVAVLLSMADLMRKFFFRVFVYSHTPSAAVQSIGGSSVVAVVSLFN